MPRDPFDILGLRPDFGLTREEIQRAYLERAGRLHPDIASGSEDAAREMADLNRARRQVENPEFRAEALLARLGGPAADRERSLPAGFLAHVMEVRERVEAELAGELGMDAARQRGVWELWSQEQRQDAVREVAALFGKLGEPGVDRDGVLRDIRVRMNAWRYIERLIEQLDPAAGKGGAG